MATRCARRASRLAGLPPCRGGAKGAEEALRRKTLDDQAIGAAAEAAFASARGREHNAFKIELGKRTLARALRQAAALQI